MANRSINKVTLLGNLTRDPELKYTPNGTAVCTFGLATNRSWTTQDGKTKEEAQYHRIIAWQKLAELCSRLLTKGKKAYLEGRITYRDYIDKSGQQKFITEIVLEDFIVFSDGKFAGQNQNKFEKTEEKESDNEKGDKSNIENHKNKDDKDKEKTEKKEDKNKNDEDVNPDDIPF